MLMSKFMVSCFRGPQEMARENIALRQQPAVLEGTAKWTAQQMVEAFPWDSTPRYLIGDIASNYGTAFFD
jgi:hypothetical protein